jgi:Asp-tRNA(Asn)/Glu-tRNA(Gln) amidotransferase A subunit family amidase
VVTVDPTVWRERGDPLVGPTGSRPLDGLRVAVKDLFAVKGCRVGAGNPTWLAEAEPALLDASAVTFLREAGAAIRGIAQTDELAYSLSGTNVHYGTPPNPAAPALVTGGSSSGPASAVALGEADIGLGKDTAGSVRVPASSCRLFGLRPTHATVPVDGVVGLAPFFDTVGWMTRDAATLRAVGEVLLPRREPASSDPLGLVLPVSMMDGIATDVTEAIRAEAARLATAWGVGLLEADVAVGWPADLPDLLGAFRSAQAAQAWRLRGTWIDAHPGALAADVEDRFRFGSAVSFSELRQAWDLLRAWRDVVASQLADGVWLVLPAAGGPAHPRTATDKERDAWRRATLACTVLASACGLPSVVVPARRDGAPVGLAIVGGAGEDHALLEAVDRAGSTG